MRVGVHFSSRASLPRTVKRTQLSTRLHNGCSETRMKAEQGNYVQYSCGGTVLQGYYVVDRDIQDRKPAVLIAHTAIGPQEEFITNKAHALARQGYAAFALDLFGAGHCVYGDEKDVYNGELRKNRNMIAERALAALATVQALPDVDPTRVAAIGFCLGGKCVLDLLRAAPPNGFLRGVVSFHGILDGGPRDAMRSVQQQKAPGPGVRALAIHGYKDPFVSDEMLLAFFKDMESRRVDFEVRIVGPVVLHAFMRPDKTSAADAEIGLQYNEVIAQRSWQAMLDFLQEVLAT